jgi:RNA polymerase sigma factor (sigma-70 family)
MVKTVDTVLLRHMIDRIRDGDFSARDELLRGVCGRLETMARQLLRGFPTVRRWADTDDVLQNSIIRLLRSLQDVEFSSMRDFFGLAATQIRRELLDLARHFSGPKYATANDDNQVGSMDRIDAASESSSLDIEAWTRFHEAVEMLPTQQREVVELVFYHQWTQAQVAEFFEVHVRTVRRWWQTALLTLSAAVREAPAHQSSH